MRMPTALTLLIASVGFCGGLGAEDLSAAKKKFNGCVNCHGTPDKGVPGDGQWIGRIATTACVQPMGPKSKSLRHQLMQFLVSDQVDRPKREDRGRDARDNEGVVSFSGKSSVLLVPASDDSDLSPIRLTWTGREKDAAAGRAVPAGTYMVRNYRLERKDKKGIVWQLWGSGSKGRKVVVKAGKTTPLEIDRRVTVKATAKPHGNKLQVGVQVQGDSHMGVTVVRKGDRVPAAYQLMRGGKKLGDGSMNYG